MKYSGERMAMEVGGAESKDKEEHLARYNFVLPWIKDKDVLDIACGTGYGSKMLADGGAKSVSGGDIDEQTIELAREKYQQSNVSFGVMDGLKIVAPEKTFDAVVSLETIEHIQEAERFVAEIARVLKNEGQLILSTPNRRATKKLGIKNPFHVREFTQEELEMILKNNFKEIKIYGQRPLGQLNLKQKFLRKAYFLYTKIKWLEFLKRWFTNKTRESIGSQIDGLAEEFQVEEMIPGREYLYFVAVGKKR
ncbi:class I SAM-dependent methyltransferase [Candidatus Kuenenbacteria bacterium]|nr:class I SAM-dependent methyltransferase [Candidatus Kuenenbacteria bacterium]